MSIEKRKTQAAVKRKTQAAVRRTPALIPSRFHGSGAGFTRGGGMPRNSASKYSYGAPEFSPRGFRFVTLCGTLWGRTAGQPGKNDKIREKHLMKEAMEGLRTMESQKSFQAFLEEEVKKVQGIYVPVRSTALRRMIIMSAPPKHLHPNPDDEFCFPDIGPNYAIITQYVKKIAEARFKAERYVFEEPITVQKIRPDGYLILNGHHRWAAALRTKENRVPIRIVNITTLADMLRILQHAKHDRRAALDLDEVVFSAPDSRDAAEPPLPFLLNRIYKERLHLGIPALFRFLNDQGYDIWVYSAKPYSMEYIRNLFRLYHVYVTGIVTGTGHKISENTEDRNRVEKKITDTYAETIHVDAESLVRVDSRAGTFQEYGMSKRENWSAEVMRIVREIAKE